MVNTTRILVSVAGNNRRKKENPRPSDENVTQAPAPVEDKSTRQFSSLKMAISLKLRITPLWAERCLISPVKRSKKSRWMR